MPLWMIICLITGAMLAVGDAMVFWPVVHAFGIGPMGVYGGAVLEIALLWWEKRGG